MFRYWKEYKIWDSGNIIYSEVHWRAVRNFLQKQNRFSLRRLLQSQEGGLGLRVSCRRHHLSYDSHSGVRCWSKNRTGTIMGDIFNGWPWSRDKNISSHSATWILQNTLSSARGTKQDKPRIFCLLHTLIEKLGLLYESLRLAKKVCDKGYYVE